MTTMVLFFRYFSTFVLHWILATLQNVTACRPFPSKTPFPDLKLKFETPAPRFQRPISASLYLTYWVSLGWFGKLQLMFYEKQGPCVQLQYSKPVLFHCRQARTASPGIWRYFSWVTFHSLTSVSCTLVGIYATPNPSFVLQCKSFMEWLWKSLLVCLLFPQQEWTSTGLNADLMSIQEFSIWSYLRCSMWSADIFTYIFMSSLQLRIPREFAVMMAIKKLVDKVTKPLRHKLIQILVSIRLWPQQINKNQQLLLFLL